MSGGGNFVLDGGGGGGAGGAAALSPFPALQPAHPVIERLEVSARKRRSILHTVSSSTYE